MSLSQLLFHVIDTSSWLFKYTSSELFHNYFTNVCFYPISSLLNTVSKTTSGTLPINLQQMFYLLMPYQTRGCQMPPNPLFQYLKHVSTHIHSLLETNLIDIFESILKHIKFINIFTCSKKFSKYAV